MEQNTTIPNQIPWIFAEFWRGMLVPGSVGRNSNSKFLSGKTLFQISNVEFQTRARVNQSLAFYSKNTSNSQQVQNPEFRIHNSEIISHSSAIRNHNSEGINHKSEIRNHSSGIRNGNHNSGIRSLESEYIINDS